MTLPWVVLSHLYRTRLELSPRIHNTFRCILVLEGDGLPTPARHRLSLGEIAKVPTRLQEDLL
jgi:hypothetical protein